jgi:hypothetical protein
VIRISEKAKERLLAALEQGKASSIRIRVGRG